jgi:L-aminopeptidase/D-esterase-like protein
MPSITDIPGLLLGHASDYAGMTGCTVLLAPKGAVAGVAVRGYASGTLELEALSPLHLVEQIHAVLLTGGSAFGLEAAAGVMQFLSEQKVGFDAKVAKVPLVPGAVIFDLSVGSAKAYPTKEMGYRAAQAAAAKPSAEGSVGAGTGAAVGKLFGIACAMKGGMGTHCQSGPNGLLVGALAVVNAFGDVVDDAGGRILAGTRGAPDGRKCISTALQMQKGILRPSFKDTPTPLNTTLAVVATNARLTKVEAQKAAEMSSVGLARTISPVFTNFDGDVIFCLSLGKIKADLNLVGLLGSMAVAQAVKRAVMKAEGTVGLPSYKDLN